MQRNSTVELFRILAILFVIIAHWNGWFVGGIAVPDVIKNEHTILQITQLFISSATSICVNMFILISGYYSIKLKFKSFIKLYIILFSVLVPYYLYISISNDSFTPIGLFNQLFVFTNSGYFVQCYMMLMIVSPILNSYCNQLKEGILAWVLLFAFMEFYFGCYRDVTNLGYSRGYSVIHFVLIYMIGRTVKFYESRLKRMAKFYWLLLYLACTISIMALYVSGVKWALDYSNPFVVFSSVCFFVPFLYHRFHSNIINWFAASSLTIYIGHVMNPTYGIIKALDNKLLADYSYPSYLAISFLIITALFVALAIYDHLRRIVTNPVENVLISFFDNRISPLINRIR